MLIICKGYKTELDPNNKQRTLLRQCVGTSLFVYNWALAEWEDWYAEGGRPSAVSLCRYLNSIKGEEYPWMKDLPYAIVESATRNLKAAFKRYFKEKKDGTVAKRIAKLKAKGKWDARAARLAKKKRWGYKIDPGYPQFKRRGKNESFQLRNVRVERDRVRLTHIGWVRLKERGYIPTSDSGVKFMVYTTISRSADRWFISVQVEEELPELVRGNGHGLGVDLGSSPLAHYSDDTIFENPRALRKAERKLARLQRELSRREKGGKNWKKTQQKIQRCHARVANIRNHAHHQASHYVAVAQPKPWAIGIENLNVSGMLKNRHLSKTMSDAAPYELRRQIEYKAKWNGIGVVVADRFYPSSKKCSVCGYINDDLTLADREWVCPQCGAYHDRNLNAAKNLEPERL